MFDPISIKATELPPENNGRRRFIYRGEVGIEQALLDPGDDPDEVQMEARQRLGIKVYGQIAAHLTDLEPKIGPLMDAQGGEASAAFADFCALVGKHVNGRFEDEEQSS